MFHYATQLDKGLAIFQFHRLMVDLKDECSAL